MGSILVSHIYFSTYLGNYSICTKFGVKNVYLKKKMLMTSKYI